MKTNQIIKKFIIISLLVFIYGCNSQENQASSKAKQQLIYELPEYLELVSFEVLAAENYGNDVEPKVKGRFKAGVKLIEPLYEEVRSVGDKSVLNETVPEGKKVAMNGIYTAYLRNGEWQVRIDTGTHFSGRPASSWSVGTAVINGSKEYKTLVKNHEQAELEAIRQREERKRLEAQEREKTHQLEAQLSKQKADREAAAQKKREAEIAARKLQAKQEQQAAEAKLKQQQSAQAAKLEAKKAALRKRLAGTWKAASNIMDKQGGSYAYKPKSVYHLHFCQPSNAVRFDLSIPEADLDVLDSELTLYMTDDPSSQIKLKAAVVIGDDGETATINMPSNARLKCKQYDNKKYEPIRYSKKSEYITIIVTGGHPWTGKVGKQWDVWRTEKDRRGKEQRKYHIVLKKVK